MHEGPRLCERIGQVRADESAPAKDETACTGERACGASPPMPIWRRIRVHRMALALSAIIIGIPAPRGAATLPSTKGSSPSDARDVGREEPITGVAGHEGQQALDCVQDGTVDGERLLRIVMPP
jgi:hypothetical protein